MSKIIHCDAVWGLVGSTSTNPELRERLYPVILACNAEGEKRHVKMIGYVKSVHAVQDPTDGFDVMFTLHLKDEVVFARARDLYDQHAVSSYQKPDVQGIVYNRISILNNDPATIIAAVDTEMRLRHL